jgi:hypothetical protein
MTDHDRLAPRARAKAWMLDRYDRFTVNQTESAALHYALMTAEVATCAVVHEVLAGLADAVDEVRAGSPASRAGVGPEIGRDGT